MRTSRAAHDRAVAELSTATEALELANASLRKVGGLIARAKQAADEGTARRKAEAARLGLNA